MTKLISQQCKEISLDAIKNTTDFVLFMLAFGVGLGVSGRSTRGVHRAAQFAEGVNVDQIRRAIAHMRSKGWIKRDLHVTREGQKRISTFIPEVRKYPKRWSGVWYLVSFDIPERIAWKRNNFRIALSRMGFGKLHASLWISPYNFLGDVARYCKSEQLQKFVLPAISNKVGTRMSQELADQVWRLEQLNDSYRAWIEQCGKGITDPEDHFKLIFEYSALLRRDPFLPKPLLPSPWYGEQSHKLFKTLAPFRIMEA
ncbi:MAG: PaaX family transcriptional regulator C-terminal domain-containing protein [bacterium]|nr:PaaX family transcriptional regulator C-terminal domain-containing protein [bacterium]